jgi:hypothetical protein
LREHFDNTDEAFTEFANEMREECRDGYRGVSDIRHSKPSTWAWAWAWVQACTKNDQL